MKRNRWPYYVLIGIGLLQITGFLTGIPAIRGIGAATAASPLPIVFTEVKGVETFALRFTVTYETTTGSIDSMEITPEVYGRLHGAYNWRNVYGAAFSYGPVLPAPLRDRIFRYGFCDPGELTTLLNTRESIRSATLRIDTKTSGRHEYWIFPIECTPR